jgi:alkyl sulfatase BDS1-like metallo-beta-lactamase superfamily hydrolase
LSVRLNGPKAGAAYIALNFEFTDTKEKYLVTLENAVLHHFRDKQDAKADATVSLSRLAFVELVLGEAKIDDLVANGKAKVTGRTGAVSELVALFDYFNFWFEIVMP